jgi:hypothetical protein
MRRPGIVLRLQPWSTAISQTRNRTMAQDARILVHILATSRRRFKLPIQARITKRTLITVLGDLPGRPVGSARRVRIEWSAPAACTHEH